MLTFERRRRRRRPEAGFTYLGLLLLLALFGLASAMTLEVVEQSARREAENELAHIGGAFHRAFFAYYTQTPVGAKRYPASLEDLVRDPRYPGVKRHLRQIRVDPLTGKADWGLIAAPEGGIMGVYSQFEGTPIRGELAGKFPPLAVSPTASAAMPAGSGLSSYRQIQFGYAPDPAATRRPAPAGMPSGAAMPGTMQDGVQAPRP